MRGQSASRWSIGALFRTANKPLWRLKRSIATKLAYRWGIDAPDEPHKKELERLNHLKTHDGFEVYWHRDLERFFVADHPEDDD